MNILKTVVQEFPSGVVKKVIQESSVKILGNFNETELKKPEKEGLTLEKNTALQTIWNNKIDSFKRTARAFPRLLEIDELTDRIFKEHLITYAKKQIDEDTGGYVGGVLRSEEEHHGLPKLHYSVNKAVLKENDREKTTLYMLFRAPYELENLHYHFSDPGVHSCAYKFSLDKVCTKKMESNEKIKATKRHSVELLLNKISSSNQISLTKNEKIALHYLKNERVQVFFYTKTQRDNLSQDIFTKMSASVRQRAGFKPSLNGEQEFQAFDGDSYALFFTANETELDELIKLSEGHNKEISAEKAIQFLDSLKKKYPELMN